MILAANKQVVIKLFCHGIIEAMLESGIKVENEGGLSDNKTEWHQFEHLKTFTEYLHHSQNLDKEEAGAEKETSNDMVEENGEEKLEEASISK
nr:hypothetical protein [Tanacetum cinerariifolium]